jgi:hypothetical protein
MKKETILVCCYGTVADAKTPERSPWEKIVVHSTGSRMATKKNERELAIAVLARSG